MVPLIQGDWCLLLSWWSVVEIGVFSGLVPTKHHEGIGVSIAYLLCVWISVA